MASHSTVPAAFVASVIRPHSDAYLASRRFCQGMVIFALPDYGVLFKCRAEGRQIDLEFGAFFALLGFIETSLAAERIGAVHIYSSVPEFVFAFSGQSRYLEVGGERARLLRDKTAKISVEVSLIEQRRNLALVSPIDLPAMPGNRKVIVKSPLTDMSTRAFRPIQKGVRV